MDRQIPESSLSSDPNGCPAKSTIRQSAQELVAKHEEEQVEEASTRTRTHRGHGDDAKFRPRRKELRESAAELGSIAQPNHGDAEWQRRAYETDA